jgi:hypothetical protein
MLVGSRRRAEEDYVSIGNADIAEQARELAEASEGLLRMAALCVCSAAFTTGSVRGAHKALEIVPHAALRDAAQLVLTELAGTGTAEGTASVSWIALT